ncbi:MAG: nitroreductase family protein [Acidimicrobiales bacterium]
MLSEGPVAAEAKKIVARGARAVWDAKRKNERYDEGSGNDPNSPKARMARSMEHYVDAMADVPVLILPCFLRHREPTVTEGASVYPACQNLLLAARGLGYGGVLTIWHAFVEDELRELLEMPEDATVAATITLGKPAGSHGPVRRVPLAELVYDGKWGDSAPGPSTRPAPATPAPVRRVDRIDRTSASFERSRGRSTSSRRRQFVRGNWSLPGLHCCSCRRSASSSGRASRSFGRLAWVLESMMSSSDATGIRRSLVGANVARARSST